ncbi:hypothetical protein Pyn_23444 [Prunus yedoensis var. nudiflora]|uniref:Uncharacterized protein n=1 Tax=Prunus yedoensis var. nudiflora TaxID=2094558 RepID=A0A314XMJ0_PRUYE|nr:hypothetical protein Pyn_23444 [Prunus yedoensis var. nudiflora]
MHRRPLQKPCPSIAIGDCVIIVANGCVLALGNWGPLVKQEMRAVITVRGTVVAVNLMRVMGGRTSVVGVRGWCYVDPLLLPLPHRPSEHRGWSVPGRGPPESGPNSLHLADGSPILRWRLGGRPIRDEI